MKDEKGNIPSEWEQNTILPSMCETPPRRVIRSDTIVLLGLLIAAVLVAISILAFPLEWVEVGPADFIPLKHLSLEGAQEPSNTSSIGFWKQIRQVSRHFFDGMLCISRLAVLCLLLEHALQSK